MEFQLYLAIFIVVAAAILIPSGLDDLIMTRRKRKLDLKNQRARVVGRTVGRIERYVSGERALIDTSSSDVKTYFLLLVLSVAAGGVFGKLVFMDTTISLLLAGFCIALPHAFLVLKGNQDRRRQADNLESTMRVITHEYIRTLDIQKAVEDCVEIIEYDKPFREFLVDCTMVSADTTRNLRRLESKIHNAFFSQWIDQLILSENDRSQASNLMPILENMNDAKTAQRLNDTKVAAAWREYFTLLFIILLSPLLVRMIQYEWYLSLVTTPIGKILVVAMLGSLVWATGRAIRINKPITG